MTDLRPGQQTDILASVIRWIDDEPQPGIVDVEFVDCDGARHRLIDKCAIFGADTAILPTAAYPMSAFVACTVLDVLSEGKASVRLAWRSRPPTDALTSPWRSDDWCNVQLASPIKAATTDRPDFVIRRRSCE